MIRCAAVLPDNQMGAVVAPDRLEEGWDRCERTAGHDGPHTVRIRLAWMQTTLVDPPVASIHFDLHVGQPSPTHVNYLKAGPSGPSSYESADEQRNDLAVSGLFDDQGANE